MDTKVDVDFKRTSLPTDVWNKLRMTLQKTQKTPDQYDLDTISRDLKHWKKGFYIFFTFRMMIPLQIYFSHWLCRGRIFQFT